MLNALKLGSECPEHIFPNMATSGYGERSAPGRRLLSRPRLRCVVRADVRVVCWWVRMVVRLQVRLCDPCALVRPRVPCVSCVSRLPPVSFYR